MDVRTYTSCIEAALFEICRKRTGLLMGTKPHEFEYLGKKKKGLGLFLFYQIPYLFC